MKTATTTTKEQAKRPAPVFSYFCKPVSNVRPERNTSLIEVYHWIRCDEFKPQTDGLRRILDTNQSRKFKSSSFDYVTFSGTFSTRNESNLLEHSGLLTIDFDHITDLTSLRNELIEDPYFDTALMFISPSGDGLKWIIPIDLTKASHQDYFKAVANYIRQTYNIVVDESGRDICRACFLPHDPDVYINPRYFDSEEHYDVHNKFDPSEWNTTESKENNVTVQGANNTEATKVELVILEIEKLKKDLTSSYGDWRNIGFAFADAFGEDGRDFYHRISQYYTGYTAKECNHQYDNCIKAHGNGITIGTFFHLAKQAGIEISTPKPKGQLIESVMPNLPDSLFPQLPEFLQRVVSIATSNEEKDLLLLGSLVSISACLPKLHGTYDGRKVYPNLFLFITAQASAGKGRLVHCRQLVNSIHKELREQAKLLKQQHELEMADYNAKKGKEEGAEKPSKPPEKMLFIPANSSSTGAYQLLGENDGKGLIFETEGDTLAHAFKSDYGNYSDGFRKAFHHETISYYRRTDREYVDIENPCISAVLSGTPKQVSALIPNSENGLFSRFMFYFMNVRPTWKDVFADTTENGLDEYFDALGAEFYELYKALRNGSEVQFRLTADQQDQFNQFFIQVQDQYLTLQGIDYMATIRRLGLIAFRISMILSALRILETGESSSQIVCDERDFDTALSIAKVMVRHSSKVFNELPEDVKPATRKNKKQKYLESLPKYFNRQKYLEVARQMNIADKTAEGYITTFAKKGLVHREMKDNYINQSIEENTPQLE